MSPTYTLIHNANELEAEQWNALNHNEQLLSHAFLTAIENPPNACPSTGWAAHHLIAKQQDLVTGILPLYLKNHSRGEYVFDQAWAQAYQQHGQAYYPRLVSAIPYTPISGPRLLAESITQQQDLLATAIEVSARNQISSLHILFPNKAQSQLMHETGLLIREGVQFHWKNRAYGDFDDFLATFRQKYRKKLRQDSRKVHEAGIHFTHRSANEISESELNFFYACYQNTYFIRGQRPYLNLDFFLRLLSTLPEALVLITAYQGDKPIASALSLRSGSTLYGRYWGAVRNIPGLHFETCYIQSIKWCIEHGIQIFEGGAQGEHKLARGLEPVSTYSAHWIADPSFRVAIADFVKRERAAVQHYKQELIDALPFKRD